MNINFERALRETYAEIARRTLCHWQEHPTIGKTLSSPYHLTQLGISTGNLFNIPGWLAELHDELTEYGTNDDRLDVVPRNSMHFTFLALANSHFATMADVPPEIESLLPLYDAYVRRLTFQVWKVALLPLNNALILAGIPDPETYEARRQFAEAILQSPWARWLRDRYQQYSIPPLLWHTTSARYNAEFLPQDIRALYQRYAAPVIPVIDLG
jgi:hypothetical protein